MRTKWLLSPIFCLLVVGSSGCTDDIKWQDKFKGIWNLQSRALPGGEELKPPQISGRMEWFPTDPTHSHVSYLTTYDPKSVQVQGDHITLSGTSTFTKQTYMRVGGGLSPHFAEGVSTDPQTTSGTITQEGSRFTWADANGVTLVFEGDLLQIRHPDGTLDTLTQ